MAISANVLEAPFTQHQGALTYERYQAERHFPVLDGVRALSIFGVILAHASGQLRSLFHGHQGVNAFFVLSGFLITTLLLREERDHGRVNLAGFYIRRSFRILPLYYLTLALYSVLLLGFQLMPDRAEFFRHALPYYALYFPEYIHLNQDGPFAHSWSLGIEEKFYALWPLLGFVLLRARSVRPLVLFGLIGSILLLPNSLDWAKYVRHYVPIAVGCLIALLLHRRELYDKLRPLGSYPGLFLALAVGAILIDKHQSSLFVASSCGIALIALVLAPAGGTVTSRFMGSNALTFVGQRAYEIYLLHQGVLNAIRPTLSAVHEPVNGPLLVVLGFAATVLVASVVHKVIGRPLTQWGRQIAKRGIRPKYVTQLIGNF
jgi:peptidoglycan/LPS O-acetylase OafA/YrhL